MHLFSSPFAHTLPKTLRNQCNVENYGFDLDTDCVSNRAYVRNLCSDCVAFCVAQPPTSRNNLPQAREEYRQKLEILPPLQIERSPAKLTCALSYHMVDLHSGYRAIGVP